MKGSLALLRRINLKWLLVAFPGALMPSHAFLSVSGDHFCLGLPSVAQLTVGCSRPTHRVYHFDAIQLLPLTILAAVWAVVGFAGYWFRRRTQARGGWLGATTNAALVTAFAFLWFFFLIGAANLLWTACLCRLDGPALASAFEATRSLYPFACVLLASALLTVLWVDSWSWVGHLRSTYLVAALCSLAAFAYLSPCVPRYMNMLDEMAQATRNDNIKQKPLNNERVRTSP